MKVGSWVNTPRFCHVKIEAIFSTEASAREAGYEGPTYYDGAEYGVLGKSLDMYHMRFAAYKKG